MSSWLGALRTRSSVNAAIISSRDITSRSSPGLQPSSASELNSASGRKPFSWNSPTYAAPSRLEYGLPCAFTIIGRCANFGAGAPMAAYIATCLNVFSTWSSPRITWVMPMVMSSTTLPRWNTGEPSERTITKSFRSSAFLERSPFTSSWNETSVPGILKMMHSPLPVPPLSSL